MKFNAIVVALAGAASVSAFAMPEPTPDPVADPTPACHKPGNACWKVARAVDSFQEVLKREAAPAPAPEGVPANGLDEMARRALADLAGVVASVDARDSDAVYDSYLAARGDPSGHDEEKRWCTRQGQSCWKNKRAVEEEPAEKRWCTRRGQSCWKREETSMTSEVERRWCESEGGSCSVAKRAAQAVVDAVNENPFSAEKRSEEEKRWCTRHGQSCWKVRRAAAEPEERRWCTRHGQSCWKRDEDSWKAERDLHALVGAAGEVLENLN